MLKLQTKMNKCFKRLFHCEFMLTNSPMLTNGSVNKFESEQSSAEKQSDRHKMMSWNTIISVFSVYKIIPEPKNQDHTF